MSKVSFVRKILYFLHIKDLNDEINVDFCKGRHSLVRDSLIIIFAYRLVIDLIFFDKGDPLEVYIHHLKFAERLFIVFIIAVLIIVVLAEIFYIKTINKYRKENR